MSESNQPSASSGASRKTECKNDTNKHQQSQSVDPELDIHSEQFNPLKALYAPAVHMSMENVTIFNNLAHFESTMNMQRQQQEQHKFGDRSVSKNQEKDNHFVLPEKNE